MVYAFINKNSFNNMTDGRYQTISGRNNESQHGKRFNKYEGY